LKKACGVFELSGVFPEPVCVALGFRLDPLRPLFDYGFKLADVRFPGHGKTGGAKQVETGNGNAGQLIRRRCQQLRESGQRNPISAGMRPQTDNGTEGDEDDKGAQGSDAPPCLRMRMSHMRVNRTES
jgi:hypothetical protein